MNAHTLLEEGIKILRGGDKEIDRLFAPRAAEIIDILDRYIKEIELFNSVYGLVGAADSSELVIKHILDSLAPLGIISRNLDKNAALQIADAGSGAGLPGIPLAIVLNGINFTLIEKMGRRAGFLLNTQAALSLSNVIIEECELERFAKNQSNLPSGGFDLITFRAFKPLEPELLKTLQKICKPGGVIAAYKGRRKKIEAEMASCVGMEWEAVPCPVPFLDEERHLVIINLAIPKSSNIR